MKKLLIVVAFLLVMPAALKAQDDDSRLKGWSAGFGVGMMGGGTVSVGYRIPYDPEAQNKWKNRFALRANYNTWAPFAGIVENFVDDRGDDELEKRRVGGRIRLNDNVFADKATFESYIKGGTFGALVDFYPFTYGQANGGFRITGGVYFGNLEIGADALITGASANVPTNFKYNLESLTVAGYPIPSFHNFDPSTTKANINDIHMDPKVTVHSTGPYVGVGWDLGLYKKLKLTLDVGMVFTKAHEVSISDNIDTVGFELSTSTGTPIPDLTIDIINVSADPNIRTAVYNLVIDDLSKRGLTYTSSGVGSNITVGVAQLIEKNREPIDTALEEVRSERNRIVRETNDRIKNYGYLPLLKIGVVWKF